MKKVFCGIITLCLMLSLFVNCPMVSIAATSGSCGENVKWILSGSVLNIYGTGDMAEYSSISSVPWYSNASKIATVNIQSGVTSVCNNAFYGMSSITNVTIANTVKKIGKSAFHGVSAKSVTIPDSVTEIESNAFTSGKIETITIGKGLSELSCEAFLGTSLCKIDVSEDNESFSSVDGVLFAKDRSKLIRYPIGRTDSEYEIPDCVSVVGEKSFSYNKNLKSIIIPESVTTFESDVFYRDEGTENVYVKSLEHWFTMSFADINANPVSGDVLLYANGKAIYDLVIPEGVSEINTNAFIHYKALKSVKIPYGVTKIEEKAFQYCYGLTKVYLSNDVQSIGASAFSGDSALSEVYYTGNSGDLIRLKQNSGKYNDSLFNATVTYNYKMPYINSVEINGSAVNVSLTDYEVGGVVVTAFFDGDTLAAVFIDNASNSISKNLPQGEFDSVKVMWFESIKCLIPACSAKVVVLEN